MNEDIVPGLLAAIENDFQKSFQSDDTLKMLYAKVENGTATQADGEKFAHELGKLTASVFHRNVRPEDLPNQRMYYNIANRIIPPTLRQNHGIVNEVMRQVIEHQNQEAGIGIRYQEPEFDEHKAHELAWIASQDVDYSRIRNTVETGLDTNTRMVADDCVRKNAEFQYDAGLSPKIERDTDGDCCSWCTDMAGTYEYARAPKEVFARHANCGCTVEFVPGNGKRQNVHTKDWTSETESAMMNSEGFEDNERSSESLSARKDLGTDESERQLKHIPGVVKKIGPDERSTFDREYVGGPFKILLSNKLDKTPKEVREYERVIEECFQLLGISPSQYSEHNLPEFLLISSMELEDRIRGRFSGEDMCVVYKPLLDADANKGTFLHELLHWTDYQNALASGVSFSNDLEFIEYMSAKAKRMLDEIGIGENDMVGISTYALSSYRKGRYDESYVEYRVMSLLGQ